MSKKRLGLQLLMSKKKLLLQLVLVSSLISSISCRVGDAVDSVAEAQAPSIEYAIAIHGGAGVIPRDGGDEIRLSYEKSLKTALSLGLEMLKDGRSALDVAEAVVRQMEDDPLFNAGHGAVFTQEGRHELDAAIMDGRTLACGAVSGVTSVRNPISLARMVMEKSRHVFFTANGAEKFADEMGVERVSQDYFFTQRRHDQWKAATQAAKETGTVGAVVLDKNGDLAAATSTGGMTGKRFGRVGDSPIIGAGTYANNRTVAVSATGTGEEFIRNVVAHDIAARLAYKGLSLQAAAEEVVHGQLRKGDGGIIAVSSKGEIALVFNSEGMFRGAADSRGRFEVRIWE